jgi:PII-like signaling protein/GNAT superfamily N-acetyltransferase
MNEDCLKLTTYFGERDRTDGRFLADALIDIYARHQFQASVLLRGVEGFGVKHHLCTDRLLSLSEDLPIVSVAVDTRERIQAALDEVVAVSGCSSPAGGLMRERSGDAGGPRGRSGARSTQAPIENSLCELGPEHHRAAATVLADAFLDDPGWVAVGPRRPRARWKFIFRTCLGAIRVGARWCGPSWCVVEEGNTVAVLTGCAPGLWPAPRARALAHLFPGPVLAGPLLLVRSLGAQRVIEAAHPAYDHFLVWMFAVSPSHQRKGLGRRLMRTALATADADPVPAYLWTGNPTNLPSYNSHGFEIVGEAEIASGALNWFMERPPCPGDRDR